MRATDQDGRVGTSDPFTISVVAPLVIAGLPPTFGDVGANYVATFTTTGGKRPYVYSMAGAALPAGLVLDTESGAVAGVPTTTGTFAGMQIGVTDGNGTKTNSQIFRIVISDPLSAAAQVGPGTVGQTFAGLVAVSGGRGPFVYSMAAGSLPAGLGIDAASGRISGTPRTAGTSSGLEARIVDADGRNATTSPFSIIVSAPLTLAGLGVPTQFGTVGSAYASGVSAAGGRGPFSYNLSSGVLPDGLTLDMSTGAVAGTPTTVGVVGGLQIVATDADGRTVSSNVFVLDIRNPVVVAGTPASFGTMGQTYAAAFSAGGGRGPYSYSASGSLPPGLSVNASTGALTGIATTAGSYPGLQVRATDADGRTGLSGSFAIAVSIPLTISVNLPTAATQGASYSGSVSGVGGRPGYGYSLIGAALPPGLSLEASSGTISGIAATTGTFTNIRIRVTDMDGRSADTAAYSMTVAAPLSASYSPTPATRGIVYGIAPSVSGGRSAYSYALSSGSLPSGLSLNASTGAIGGTPFVAQVAPNLQIRVSDADGRAVVTAPFTIAVYAPLSITLSNPLSVSIGSPVSTPAVLTGGRGPFTWSAASGYVPGIGFNTASGTFEGTPTTSGNYPSTISVSDADGRTANASTTFVVVGPLQLAGPSPDTGMRGRAFRSDFQASGGTAPYAFALISGTVPAGTSFLPGSGSISGTPSTAGSYPVGVRVTDAAGRVATATATIRIFNPLSVGGSPTSVGRVGEAYSGFLYYSGGTTPIQPSFSPSLPPGLSAAFSGTYLYITGTPTAPVGQTTYTATMQDAYGQTASTTFPLLIRGPIATADNVLPNFSKMIDPALLGVLWDNVGKPVGPATANGARTISLVDDTEVRAALSLGNPQKQTGSDYAYVFQYDDLVRVDTIVFESNDSFRLSYKDEAGQVFPVFSFVRNAGTDVRTVSRFNEVKAKTFIVSLPNMLTGTQVNELRLGWGGNAPVMLQPEFVPPGTPTGYTSTNPMHFRSTFVGTAGQQVRLNATGRNPVASGRPVTFSILPFNPGKLYSASTWGAWSCAPLGGMWDPKAFWYEQNCWGRRTGDRNTSSDGTVLSADGLLTIGSIPEGTRDVWIAAKDAAGIENHRAVRLMRNSPGADTVAPSYAAVEWEKTIDSIPNKYAVQNIEAIEAATRYRVAADLSRLVDGQTTASGDSSRLMMTTDSPAAVSSAPKRVVMGYAQPVRADGAVVSFVDVSPSLSDPMAIAIYAKISGAWERVSNWIDVNSARSELYIPFDNLPVASTEYAAVAYTNGLTYSVKGPASMGLTEFRVTYGGRNAVR